jgi:hypothetical protein
MAILARDRSTSTKLKQVVIRLMAIGERQFVRLTNLQCELPVKLLTIPFLFIQLELRGASLSR